MTGGYETGTGGSDGSGEATVAETDTGGEGSGESDSADSRSREADSTGHGAPAVGSDHPAGSDARVGVSGTGTGIGTKTGDRPNVVVFVMDTTRAKDTVPTEPAHTPTLASLAEQGTEYTRAFSTAPWTLPSHASLFTGTYPTKHGAHGEHTRLDEELPTLAELFRSADYETAGFSNNVWIDDQFGTARGFETFHGPDEDEVDPFHDDPEPWGGYESVTDFISTHLDGGSRDNVLELLQRFVTGERRTEDKGASETVADVQEWLDGRERDDPFFCFVNCIEPHLEYRPPPSYARRYLPDGWSYADAMAIRQDPRGFDVGLYTISDEEWTVLRALYRAEIAYLDDQIGAVVDALRATGEWDDTVFVVTSDHGEDIGEHGFLGHQYCLYDTHVHVPLVVAGGPFDGGTTRNDDLVQTLDLTPTLLDVAGIDAPDARREFQGQSIHPDADSHARTAVFTEHIAPRPPIDVLEDKYDHVPERLYDLQRTIRAVRTDRYKYVRGSDGSEELYDVVDDPGEEHDRSSAEPEPATELDTTLTDWLSSFERTEKTETVSVDQATEQRLSDLGYM